MKFLEALIGSLGIMAFGWLSIPVVGHFAGVAITGYQAIAMSTYFFVFRLTWLYCLRLYFAKKHE